MVWGVGQLIRETLIQMRELIETFPIKHFTKQRITKMIWPCFSVLMLKLSELSILSVS